LVLGVTAAGLAANLALLDSTTDHVRLGTLSAGSLAQQGTATGGDGTAVPPAPVERVDPAPGADDDRRADDPSRTDYHAGTRSDDRADDRDRDDRRADDDNDRDHDDD
jgi:hypothetical protein